MEDLKLRAKLEVDGFWVENCSISSILLSIGKRTHNVITKKSVIQSAIEARFL